MKTIKKIFLLLILSLITSISVSNFCNAATTTVGNEQDLINAINNASTGDIIELSTDIALTKPVEITGKDITINGNGHTITRIDTNWTPNGSNSSLITAGLSGTKVNLVNLVLKDSAKYGVQSYDGAYVTLDDVTISNCGFGGVLVNAGTVEIKKLTLNKNGQSSNNGIEIAKGNGIYSENTYPTLIMNGTISSTENENVIYLAVNDNLSKFELKNTDSTVNKVLLNGNKVVITDSSNNIVYESNPNENIQITGENYAKNVTVSINLMEQVIAMTVKEGTTITKAEVESKINLETLGINNYSLNGFYSDNAYTTEFDFTKPITTDTVIYGKLELNNTGNNDNNTDNNATDNNNNNTGTDNNNNNTSSNIENTTIKSEKDETPKTGFNNHLELSILVVSISIIGLALLKRNKIH